jgi:hypothetical protein
VCAGGMVRAVIGIVLGYVVFAGTAVALFQITRVNPHAPVRPGFAAVGGWLGGWVGQRADTGCGLVTAWIIATGAAISLIASPAPGAHWSQIAALVLMAPAAWAGDRLRAGRRLRAATPVLRIRART